MTATALLVVAVGIWLHFIRADRGELPSFKSLADTRARRRRYRRWIGRSFLLFALPAVAGLALLGRLDALARLPPEFAPVAARFAREAPARGDLGWLAGAMLGGLAAGLLGSMALSRLVHRRSGRAGPPRQLMLGDVAALLPRNRAELGHAALLSVSAGVTEELFFRLLLPLLVALATGSAAAGFVAAGLMFGLAHLYQGWIGVAATAAVGALMTAVYLGTGSIWAAVALHAGVDLVGLVVRPALAGAWRVAG